MAHAVDIITLTVSNVKHRVRVVSCANRLNRGITLAGAQHPECGRKQAVLA